MVCAKAIRSPFIFVALAFFTVSFARGDGRDDDMRWETAESEVKETRYPATFLDSLAKANNAPTQKGLRTYRKWPFQNREKLVFDGGWGFARAGFLILSAQADDDPSVMALSGKVATNNFASAFYKVRDYVFSYADADGMYPLFFEQHIAEGKYRDHRWTLYDHPGKRVFTYKTKDSSKEASSFTQNYMTLLYYLRTLDLKPGKTVAIPCFVHEKDYPIEFTILGRERVETPAGEFRCLKIKPSLVGEGRGLTKRDKMYIWLTDDEYKMPVLVRSKIAIGSLSAKLLYYERE
jgi:hypothetical protein